MFRRTLTLTVLCSAAVSLSAVVIQSASAATPATQEVSVATTGGTANGYGDRPEISGDGTKVTFDSDATNMSTTDPAGLAKTREVFERDLTSQTTHLVSIGIDGKAANDWTSFSWPDQDGALVTFTSDATNLVSTKVNARSVYLRNTSSAAVNGIPAKTTVLVSANSSGVAANGASSRSMISPDGLFIAYNSTATNLTSTPTLSQSQEYLYNVQTHQTQIISTDANGNPGNKQSYRGMVANGGNTVAFDSQSTNLSPKVTNGQENIYLKNMTTGALTVVSNKYPSNTQASGSRPYMSPDGTWITFNSNAALLASDTNATTDVYVYNTQTGVLTLGSPGLSGAPGNGQSLRGFITNDGRYVVFNSFATNLTAKDTNGHGDVFALDTTTGIVTMLSLSAAGGPANGNSFRPVPSSDGSEVTFLSQATNLVPGGSAPAPPNGGSTDGDDSTTNYEAFAVSMASLSAGGDTTAPAATITSPVKASTVSSPVSIAGTATDNVAVSSVSLSVKDNTSGGTNSGKFLQADGSFGTTQYWVPTTLASPDSASTNWSVPVSLPNSKYLVQVKVLDTAGNQPTTKPNETFTVNTTSHTDSGPPTVTVVSPTNNATVSGSPFVISGNAADDTAVAKVTVAIRDNGTALYLQANGSWASTFYATPVTLASPNATMTTWSGNFTLPNGSYGVTTNAYDELNQAATTKPFVHVTVVN